MGGVIYESSEFFYKEGRIIFFLEVLPQRLYVPVVGVAYGIRQRERVA